FTRPELGPWRWEEWFAVESSLVLSLDPGDGRSGSPLQISHEKLTTSYLINGSPCGEIDMVIKYLDLEPKIDAMMRDFLDLSRWKEFSKETSSKILPGGDGSCMKKFKPIANLVMKEKLK
nr:hypothetical protein [Tanacetum cinerariifolium]